MKVIIKNNFYEFQNTRTDDIFEDQKNYLSKIIYECEERDDQEQLLTTLFALHNLTEALIGEYVDKQGVTVTLKALEAKKIR